MILWIKKYALIGLGALVGVLLIAVKYLTSLNSKLRATAERAEAKVHHAKVVVQETQKNESEFRSRRAQAQTEVSTKGSTSELSDPNDDWTD